MCERKNCANCTFLSGHSNYGKHRLCSLWPCLLGDPSPVQPWPFLGQGWKFCHPRGFLSLLSRWVHWKLSPGVWVRWRCVIFVVEKAKGECNPKLQDQMVFPVQKNVWLQKYCGYSVAGCCAGAGLFCINQYSSVQRDERKIQKLDQIHPELYVFPVELLESLTIVWVTEA